MWIAGEPSGDVLAAELAPELKRAICKRLTDNSPFFQPLFTPLEPQFFGAGGSKMKSAGIEINYELVRHSAIGPVDALKNIKFYKTIFDGLLRLAFSRLPDLIICVDFSGFNLRFAEALRKEIKRRRGAFFEWSPKIIQYVSPQVWASRPWRAKKIAENFDLLLSIFPFEKEWYAKAAPGLRVEFVGHPLVDRYPAPDSTPGESVCQDNTSKKRILLLPGSRFAELKRHLPVMVEAAQHIRAQLQNVEFLMVLPDEELKNYALGFVGSLDGLLITIGDIQSALTRADVAIASTGTVTLECAYFKLPAVAIYKTSFLTYLIARQLIKIRFLAMPNIIAGEEIFPELIQKNANAENIARKTIEIIQDSNHQKIKEKLDSVIKSLGQPGAAGRAADIVADLILNKQA